MADECIWLREVDAGTDNACMVVCAEGDPGAVRYIYEDVVGDMVYDGHMTYDAHKFLADREPKS